MPPQFEEQAHLLDQGSCELLNSFSQHAHICCLQVELGRHSDTAPSVITAAAPTPSTRDADRKLASQHRATSPSRLADHR
eukprot:1901026-Rhodomonas_salina.3